MHNAFVDVGELWSHFLFGVTLADRNRVFKLSNPPLIDCVAIWLLCDIEPFSVVVLFFETTLLVVAADDFHPLEEEHHK